MNVERKRMIWLLCFTAILLKVVDALTTYVGGIVSPYAEELNPYMAQLFAKYGETNPLPYVIATVCPSLAVICMTIWGVMLAHKHRLIEPIIYYTLFAINITGAYIGWWNTVQLPLFGR